MNYKDMPQAEGLRPEHRSQWLKARGFNVTTTPTDETELSVGRVYKVISPYRTAEPTTELMEYLATDSQGSAVMITISGDHPGMVEVLPLGSAEYLSTPFRRSA